MRSSQTASIPTYMCPQPQLSRRNILHTHRAPRPIAGLHLQRQMVEKTSPERHHAGACVEDSWGPHVGCRSNKHFQAFYLSTPRLPIFLTALAPISSAVWWPQLYRACSDGPTSFLRLHGFGMGIWIKQIVTVFGSRTRQLCLGQVRWDTAGTLRSTPVD